VNVPKSWNRIRRQVKGLPPDPRQHHNEQGQPKKGHAMEWQAKQQAKRLSQSPGYRLRPGCTGLVVYRCDICDLWHMGQQ